MAPSGRVVSQSSGMLIVRRVASHATVRAAKAVARRYVADAAVGQAPVKLQRVDAGYAEHGVDAVGFEQPDRGFAACRMAACRIGGQVVTCGSFRESLGFESPGGTG